MAISPEIKSEAPQVTQIPETPQISEGLKEAGVEVTPSQPSSGQQPAVQQPQPQIPVSTPQISDQTVVAQAPVFAVPADQIVLQTYQKGNISDSKTWFGFYWIRAIKKALHLGWRVVIGQQK